ncbi:MAG: capsular polysaccharide biosynthesis protein [Kordiimonadaceae bacterium]|nr:capsular polysaccharide biosynthesis protein [Kordiimonadaceae bacterium]MBO6569525.1 capsular polysaccharide biosynthesis protein [Kordiimonadaceae bacterium]MBO6965000.1 capsular polysaccharide biosynthesis protein [Kordiimonadaceae bacterium]
MKAVTASRGIARDKALPVLLGCPVSHGLSARTGDVVVGWGEKENTEKARAYAQKNRLDYWRLEDGFIGYLSHPSIDDRRLSLVVDKSGIYYDAHGSSDLEKLLNQDDWITEDLTARARCAINRMLKWRISKYNHAYFDLSAELKDQLQAFKGPKVLVVDQTFGDKSIGHGMASDGMFKEMLEAALEENPTALVIVKVHPDVLAGTKQGHFDLREMATRDTDRVLFVAENCNPHALMAKVDHVYVVTSQLGFEGLMAGKKVTCYGVPFYAGWGLTHDRQLCENRATNRTLEELFAAAFILYSRYVDPFTGERIELERVLDILVAEKQMPRPTGKRVIAAGFSLWKRGFIPEFFGPSFEKTIFTTPCSLEEFEYQDGDIVALWGRSNDEAAAKVPQNVPVWRMEDGFIRSVGLGAELRRPSSLVMDHAGIYYDSTCASDLESFLNTHTFDADEERRGGALRTAILEARVSKYNVGTQGSLDFRTRAGDKQVILVPGQVEGDASLQFGSPNVFKNADLLKTVREANPDAYIIFKPHPDVLTGNREGAVPTDVLDACANETVIDADIIDCLDAVDAVHTMTSLTGFEALLRGKPVTTYGLPFYAGWGLTHDQMACERRTAKLPLDALVYAVLCVYGRYVGWPGGKSTSPEQLVEAMSQANRTGGLSKSGPIGAIGRWGRKARYLAEALTR